jgi:hypothetical protein
MLPRAPSARSAPFSSKSARTIPGVTTAAQDALTPWRKRRAISRGRLPRLRCCKREKPVGQQRQGQHPPMIKTRAEFSKKQQANTDACGKRRQHQLCLANAPTEMLRQLWYCRQDQIRACKPKNGAANQQGGNGDCPGFRILRPGWQDSPLAVDPEPASFLWGGTPLRNCCGPV